MINLNGKALKNVQSNFSSVTFKPTSVLNQAVERQAMSLKLYFFIEIYNLQQHYVKLSGVVSSINFGNNTECVKAIVPSQKQV